MSTELERSRNQILSSRKIYIPAAETIITKARFSKIPLNPPKPEPPFPVFELTVEIVHLEEEDHLLVGALAGKLLHGLNELRLGDGSAAVAIKDSEGSFDKELLRI